MIAMLKALNTLPENTHACGVTIDVFFNFEEAATTIFLTAGDLDGVPASLTLFDGSSICTKAPNPAGRRPRRGVTAGDLLGDRFFAGDLLGDLDDLAAVVALLNSDFGGAIFPLLLVVITET